MKNSVIIIYGPTASGKTDLVFTLAQHLSCEVINMDSAQLYEPLFIGTAKPDLMTVPVPHHLFDYQKDPINVTVVTYKNMVIDIVRDIQSRGKVPIIVGGSGFYLKSLFFTPSALPYSKQTSDENDYSWNALQEIDPERAQAINPADSYRIARALEIWHHTGQKPSTCVPHFVKLFPFYLIHVSRDRDELYERINKRVDHMLEAGFLQEVRSLLGTPWESFLNDKKFIGYNELIGYSRAIDADYEITIELIKKRSRNYAKRQQTFWRMLKKQLIAELTALNDTAWKIEELNLTISDPDLYIKELLEKLRYLE